MHNDVHSATPTPRKSKRKTRSKIADEHSEFNPTRGEQAMWRGVITQALMDASSNSKKTEAIYFKGEALHWLLEGGQDFSIVCYYAGLEPDYVRRMAKNALERGCCWHCETTEPKRVRKRRAERKITQPVRTLVPTDQTLASLYSNSVSCSLAAMENAA